MLDNIPQLILKEGRLRPLERRHPWVFSGAIDTVRGDPSPGATVEIRSADGDILALAAFSPESQIRARVWTWDPNEPMDSGYFRRRLESAIRTRDDYRPHANALRLVYAESDGLPGLIVDRYADVLVVQFLSAGVELWRETITSLLMELCEVEVIYERSDVEVRALEGLPARQGPLHGELPAGPIQIVENSLLFSVDIENGHKTGFYLDQRLNRLRVRQLSAGKDVLDGFCYTGSFAANALMGGASSVTLIDNSAEALSLASENLTLNELPVERAEFLDGDIFQLFRKFRDKSRSFDLIILDPPKFAPTRSHVERAARAYKDVNLLAFKLLRPGGQLLTFSCSGGVDAGLFQKIIAGAALDAAVEARILERFSQAPDHPIALNFPEGAYLKGLLCQIA